MANVYVPGGVAGILGGSTKDGPKTPTKKKLKAKEKALQALFSKPSHTPVNQEPKKSPKKKKKNSAGLSDESATSAKNESKSPKKRKSNDITKAEMVQPAKKSKVNSTSETTTQSKEKPVKPKDRTDQRKNRKKKNPEKNIRTVFVGNLPNTASKRKIEAFFKKYGTVESVRFRSAAPADLKLPKKAVINTKAFHKELNSMNGYVVFKEKKAAKDALEGNGEILEGKHIKIDLAKNAKKVDTKTSVFIGNLPFDVEDDELRSFFEDCGEIEGIRIIRESRTGLGKGFGYIKFKDRDGVDMALRLNSRLFQKRTLRVQKAEEQSPKKKTATEEEKIDKQDAQISRTTATAGEKRKKGFSRNMPSNVSSKDFQGIKAKSIEKMKKKQKQKKKLKKQRDAGKGIVKLNKFPAKKGTAARARIAKKMKKATPRNA